MTWLFWQPFFFEEISLVFLNLLFWCDRSSMSSSPSRSNMAPHLDVGLPAWVLIWPHLDVFFPPRALLWHHLDCVLLPLVLLWPHIDVFLLNQVLTWPHLDVILPSRVPIWPYLDVVLPSQVLIWPHLYVVFPLEFWYFLPRVLSPWVQTWLARAAKWKYSLLQKWLVITHESHGAA